MKCPKCGAELMEGSEFCVVCGRKLPKRKKCAKCGEEMLEDAMFCTNCGNEFVPEVIYDEGSSKWKWIIAILFLLIACGVGAYYLYPKFIGGKNNQELTAQDSTQYEVAIEQESGSANGEENEDLGDAPFRIDKIEPQNLLALYEMPYSDRIKVLKASSFDLEECDNGTNFHRGDVVYGNSDDLTYEERIFVSKDEEDSYVTCLLAYNIPSDYNNERNRFKNYYIKQGYQVLGENMHSSGSYVSSDCLVKGNVLIKLHFGAEIGDQDLKTIYETGEELDYYYEFVNIIITKNDN